MRGGLPVLVSAVLLAGCGGAAHGTRAPTGAERVQIVHFMHFWWRNGDAFAAVRTTTPRFGEIRVSQRDPHFATVLVHTRRHETQKIGLMLWGGIWEIVVGPGDWSSTCTSPSPKALVDLYCSERSTREPPTIPSTPSS